MSRTTSYRRFATRSVAAACTRWTDQLPDWIGDQRIAG